MKRPAKLLYQTNRLAYLMMMLHIVSITIYLIVVLLNMTISWRISYVSLSNIILMLFAFLVAVKINVYDAKFQYVPFVLAIYQIYQAMNVPSGVIGSQFQFAVIASLSAAGFAILSSIISIYRNNIRTKIIQESKISKNHFAK